MKYCIFFLTTVIFMLSIVSGIYATPLYITFTGNIVDNAVKTDGNWYHQWFDEGEGESIQSTIMIDRDEDGYDIYDDGTKIYRHDYYFPEPFDSVDFYFAEFVDGDFANNTESQITQPWTENWGRDGIEYDEDEQDQYLSMRGMHNGLGYRIDISRGEGWFHSDGFDIDFEFDVGDEFQYYSMGDEHNFLAYVAITNVTSTFDAQQPVPEPTTICLLGIGLFGLAGFRKKFKR